MEVVTDKRLREVFVGDMENMQKKDIVEKYGTLYTVGWHEHFGTFVSPNGESVPEAADREIEALLDIAASNPGKTVLIATHAGVLRAVWGRISGVAAEDICKHFGYATNASYSVMEFDGERLVPVSYSNDHYLGDMRTEWKDR
jgi:broad specificity phosphatase PhoE